MKFMNKYEIVKDLITKKLGRFDDELLDTPLDELEMDSMGWIELISDVEFGLSIRIDDLDGIDFSQRLGDFVDQLLAQ